LVAETARACHCQALRSKNMHIHVGVLAALNIFAHVIVIGFFWRLVALLYADTAWGQAMALIY